MKLKTAICILFASLALSAQSTRIYGGRIVDAGINLVGTVGGTNTYTATASPAIGAYTAGVSYCGNVTNANSGAATLNINTLGAVSIVKYGATALASGDIAAGRPHCFTYDATAGGSFQIQWLDNPPTGSGTVNSGATAQLAGYTGAGTTVGPVDLADHKISPSANCNNATPGTAWNLPTSSAAVPTCYGTNTNRGVLAYADAQSAAFDYEIPADWNTAVESYVNLFLSSTTNTTGTMIFQVATACTKADGSISDDPTYTTPQSFPTVTAAAANRSWSTSIQLNAMTSGNNCIPGGTMHIKISRTTDTATGAVNVSKATIDTPRRPVVQAN